MKCKSCNGTGKINVIDFAKQGWKDTEKVCPICHGTGTIEQTNEDWFCQLSTEEKADVLAKQKCDGCHDEPYDEEYGVCKYCMMKKKEQIRAWLKQPHTERMMKNDKI